MTERVRVQRDIKAPADTVYGMISDVTRMSEWSPETTECEWTGSASGAAAGRSSGAETATVDIDGRRRAP